MKKIVPFICLFITCLFTAISLPAQVNTLYDELVSVNPEWKYQADAENQLRSTAAKPLSEQQMVQYHLAQTEKLLRSRSVENLSPKQKQNRLRNLDVLHQYMLACSYPINTMHCNRQPYFIDDNNTYCAVGYLMKESGADSIARYIHETQNFSYLKDIEHKDLLKWVEESGLTVDELALIQPAYFGDWPAVLTEFHYNNTGVDVNEYIEVRQGTGGSSRFDTVWFYDNNATLYKTLPIADMQKATDDFYTYYYLFPAGESFADSGRVEITGRLFGTSSLLSRIDYNSDSVIITDYLYGITPGVTKYYMIAENEATQVNTSLSFCGNYKDNWHLISQQASIGTFNSCIVLPVTFGDFNYTLDQNKVNLSWQTLTETNSKSFSIERSADGKNFTEIGSLPATGNNGSAKQYHYTDNSPQYINYYRLKQTDISSTGSYSKILYVKVEAASKLVLNQTFVTSDLALQVTATGISRIEIFDVTGKKKFAGKVGSGVQHINVSSFAQGKYFIRLFAATGEVYTKSFIKQLLL